MAPTESTTTTSGTSTGTRVIGVSGDLAFGMVAVGQSISRTFTITNSGNSTLAWTSLDVDFDNGQPVPLEIHSYSPQSGTVAPGDAQDVQITVLFNDLPDIPGVDVETNPNLAGTATVNSDATSGTSSINWTLTVDTNLIL